MQEMTNAGTTSVGTLVCASRATAAEMQPSFWPCRYSVGLSDSSRGNSVPVDARGRESVQTPTAR